MNIAAIIKAQIGALLGRRLWLKAKRKHGIERDGTYLIMMPDSDREFNEIALRHLDDFLDYRKGSAAVILTTDEWTENNAKRFSRRIAAVERITEQDHRYYSSYCDNSHFRHSSFSAWFIMMSLQGFNGRRLALAEGLDGIDKEDLVCLGLYLIRDWEKTGM